MSAKNSVWFTLKPPLPTVLIAGVRVCTVTPRDTGALLREVPVLTEDREIFFEGFLFGAAFLTPFFERDTRDDMYGFHLVLVDCTL